MSLPSLVHPGQLLGPSSKYSPGPGTHEHNSSIYASLAGRPRIIPPSSPSSAPTISTPSHQQSTTSNTPRSSHQLNPTTTSTTTTPRSSSHKPLPTISIPRLHPSPTSAPIPSPQITNTNTLPTIGSEVLCRVTRLSQRQVDVRILQVGEQVCGDEWAGVVRREDIRATEKDRVIVHEGFRVGDLVRAVVISLGDQSNYYLSTARNELGVIMARSEVGGNMMVPVSWMEFMDPVTGGRERRKVAKPI